MSTDQLPDDIEPFVAAERARPRPSGGAIEDRVLARLNASIAALPAAAAAVAPGSAPLKLIKGGAAGKLGIAAVAFVLGTGTGVGVTLLTVARDVVPVAVPVVVAPAPPSAPAPVEPVVVDAEPVPPPLKPIRKPPVKPTEPPPADALRAERALIEIARTAISRHNYSDAISALEQHQSQYLWGQLAEEREALWVTSLAGAGQHAEAKKRADAFKQLFPQSPLLPVVTAALGDAGR